MKNQLRLLAMPLTPEQLAADKNTPPEQLQRLAKKSIELARIVARNPNTDPELLTELATSNDRTTRENVASNPNTPIEVLLKLGAEFPEQLLDNPIFSLLLLENPNLFNQISLTTLRSILKQEKVPVYFLERAADSQDLEVQLALATNPNTPKHILEKLTKCKKAQVAEAAELHINWTGEITEGWDEVAREAIKKSNLPHLQDSEAKLAAIEAIPEFLLPFLLEEVRRSIAIHSSNPSILELLAADASSGVRCFVVKNPNTPARLLEQLAQDRHAGVCEDVASNLNTPLGILKLLVTHENPRIASRAAENPTLPVATLKQLVWSKHISVCIAAVERLLQCFAQDVENRRYILDYLLLVQEQSYLVRCLIAKNPNTPVSILQEMAQKYEGDVVRWVCLNPSTPRNILEEIVKNKLSDFDDQLAKRLDNLANIVEKLAKHTSVKVRREIAKNSRTPAYVLERLGEDPDVAVRKYVASHINTPESTLQKLVQARESNVQLEANTRLETIAKEKLELKNNANPNRKVHLPDGQNLTAREKASLDDLSKNDKNYKYVSYRQQLARALRTSKRILDYLAGDESDYVRQDVALNPNTFTETLERLASDENREVRQAAINNLAMRNPDNLPAVLESYAKSKQPSFNRLIAFFHPQAPASLLAENFRALSWLERYAIAQNPSTSLLICQRLAQDGNRVVRAAAKANLETCN